MQDLVKIPTKEEIQEVALNSQKREEQILLITSVDYCLTQNLKTEIDCFHSKSKTLGFLENNQKGSGMALVAILVSDLADTFNIGKNMSAAQVSDTALLIVTEYKDLKIDDIAFCFTKAKKGMYGKVYDRLDSAIIFTWLQQFMADKEEQIEYFWQHQQLQVKSEGETLLLDTAKPVENEVAIEKIREIKQKVIDIQRRNYAAKTIISKPVEENLMQQIHNGWMKEFMQLWESETWDLLEVPRGTRFITKYGIKIDIAEYLQIKHSQFMSYVAKIASRWTYETMFPRKTEE